MITREEFETLRSRLAALEAECGASRRSAGAWRRLAGFGFLLVAAVLLSSPGREAQARADNDITVEARQFVLKDGNGKVRAVLKMGDKGPFLALYREDNSLAAAIVTNSTDAWLTLHDAKDKARAYLSVVGEKGYPQLLLQDAGEKAGVMAGWSRKTEEGPLAVLLDDAGKRRATFGIVKPEPTAIKAVPVLLFKDELDKVVFSKP